MQSTDRLLIERALLFHDLFGESKRSEKSRRHAVARGTVHQHTRTVLGAFLYHTGLLYLHYLYVPYTVVLGLVLYSGFFRKTVFYTLARNAETSPLKLP